MGCGAVRYEGVHRNNLRELPALQVMEALKTKGDDDLFFVLTAARSTRVKRQLIQRNSLLRQVGQWNVEGSLLTIQGKLGVHREIRIPDRRYSECS